MQSVTFEGGQSAVPTPSPPPAEDHGLPSEGESAPAPEPFGDLLRSAREQAGQTVEQVCATTRIQPRVLRELERGSTAAAGGPAYARGHLRSIASALGVDPAPLLEAFDAENGKPEAAPLLQTVPLQAPHVGALQVPRAERPERRGPNWGVAVAAAGGVLVVLLAVGAVTGNAPSGPAPSDVLLAEPTAPPAPRRAAPRPVAPDAVAKVAVSGAQLRVRVLSGSSWIRVQSAGGTMFEGVVTQGSPPRDFRDAKELRLLVGNAAAVSVVCGGKDLAPAGAAGKVRRFTCSASGLVAA